MEPFFFAQRWFSGEYFNGHFQVRKLFFQPPITLLLDHEVTEVIPKTNSRKLRIIFNSQGAKVVNPRKTHPNLGLVGGIPTPLKNMKVSWDDYSQYMEK